MKSQEQQGSASPGADLTEQIGWMLINGDCRAGGTGGVGHSTAKPQDMQPLGERTLQIRAFDSGPKFFKILEFFAS